MVLHVCLPPLGSITSQMHGSCCDPKFGWDAVDGKVVLIVIKPYSWLCSIKGWELHLREGMMRQGLFGIVFLKVVGLFRRDGFCVFLLFPNIFWNSSSSSTSITSDSFPSPNSRSSLLNCCIVNWATACPLALTCFAIRSCFAAKFSTFCVLAKTWFFRSYWARLMSFILSNTRLTLSRIWSHFDLSSSLLFDISCSSICVCLDSLILAVVALG